MVEYEYCGEKKIFIRRFKGDITMDVVIDSWKSMKDSGLFTSGIKGVMSNYMGPIKIEYSEMDRLLEFYKENATFLSNVSLMKVIEVPAVAMLFMFKRQNPEFHMEIFSAELKALLWFEKCNIPSARCSKIFSRKGGDSTMNFCYNCSKLDE